MKDKVYGNNYCQKCGIRITKPNHKCKGVEEMNNYEKMWKEFKNDIEMCIGKPQYDDDTMQHIVQWMDNIENPEKTITKEQTEELPSVIMEHVIETENSIIIREYDMNKPSSPPTKRQICFADPFDKGSICVDWSDDKQSILSLLDIPYTIYEPRDNGDEIDE